MYKSTIWTDEPAGEKARAGLLVLSRVDLTPRVLAESSLFPS